METGLVLDAEVSAEDQSQVTSIAYIRVSEKEVQEGAMFYCAPQAYKEEEGETPPFPRKHYQSQAELAAAMNELLQNMESTLGKRWFILIQHKLTHTSRTINQLLLAHNYPDLLHWRDGSTHEHAIMYGRRTPSKLSLYMTMPFVRGTVVPFPHPCIERPLLAPYNML